MKVNVTLQVEVNLDEWNAVYGDAEDNAMLRRRVQSLIHGAIAESSAADEGAIQSVVLK